MPAIETSDLTKYYGQARGIIDVSLEVKEGEIFGFIGPNGAGKTTAIRTLLGLVRPTSGKAEILGQPIPTAGGELYRRVGYVPSEVNYYPEMTGRSLLDYAASFHDGYDRTWTDSLIERLQFDPGRRIRAYSHGNRKKLGIIQALLHHPRLVILDEPSSGLDPLIRSQLFEILKELNDAGMTVFFSTHVLEEVDRICHRVGMVREGRLIEVTPIDKLPGRDMRLVTLKMTGEQSPEDLAGAGQITRMKEKPGYYQLTTQVPVNELMRRLGELDLESIRITDPSIEDIFFTMYEDGPGGGGSDV